MFRSIRPFVRRAVSVVPALVIALVPIAVQAFETPKTFLFYGRNYFEPGDAEIIAKYDVVALDADAPASVVAEIRSFNPAVKVLAYIPINGTWEVGPLLAPDSKWREMYEACEANNWWLRNTQGGHIYDHPGKWTANMTASCPTNLQGQKFTDWYPEFITQSVLQNGGSQWDGVFLDDVWVGIYFVNNNGTLNPYPIDSDQDGIIDGQSQLDAAWKAGNETIVNAIRATMQPGEILTGNGGNPFYTMNGAMLETFPFKGQPEGHPLGWTWTSSMFGTYGYFDDEDNYNASPVRMNILNTKWSQGDRYEPVRTAEYERQKRFVLASTLLRDGYFSIDWAPPEGGGHASLWWDPDLDKPIGTPTGAPYQATYNGTTLWRRDYTNGSVLLNYNGTTFLGSAADGIPPIAWSDARVLLSNEFWQPETVPPAPVSDLSITRTWDNQIEVQWTNSGDDGTDGQAVAVEVRRSTSPITEANWSSATPAPQLVPNLPGQQQLQIVTGLTQNTTYWFAIKTKDMAGNWSLVSNSPSGTTVIGDITPPDPVVDLQILSSTSTTMTVQWTTTGDDGSSGTASQFDLRYATFPLTAANFSSGAAVSGEPVPGPPGTVHGMTTYSMLPGTLYYFAVKVGDEMPNWSAISNVPSMATLPGDTTPPSAITDLRVTGTGSNSVSLAWSAPGDDGMAGKATQYDLRYATYPITDGNFNGTNYVATEPSPGNPGVTENLTISTGLGNGYTYYFALKTRDEASNWSTLSNNCVGTTGTQADVTPPASVTNLAVTGVTPTTAALSWTAPGDNGSTGTAALYEIRYATFALNAGNFASGTLVTAPPNPAMAGTAQNKTVTGLVSGLTYYFALKTCDRIPNWSGLSNVPSAMTIATDVTPPGEVLDLSVTGTTSSTATLSWTAPGDDGFTGTATAYEIRYATSPLSAGNFASGTLVASPPAPAVAGTTQGVTVGGLNASTTYWFALRARDEVPNWSAISNSPSGATAAVPPPADTTPPSAVANLSITATDTTSLTLSWTAPGDDGASGTATTYDLRRSTAPITAANFAAATAVTAPTPAAAGSTQTQVVTGLAPSTTYWFALKTADEVPNWSAVSNVPSGATATPPPPADTTPPAQIKTLALSNVTTTSVTLTWTSPGDDDTTGTAQAYEIKRSAGWLDTGNFSTGTLISGAPAPASAGTVQSMTVTGLSPSTTYYFAMRARDEVPNWSLVSNCPSVTTAAEPPPPPADTTPPAAIADLAITGSDTTSLTLAWTAPGDDGTTGTAATYDLRRSTAPITAANFAAATAVTAPGPAAAGTPQTLAVTGLAPSTTYYFAMKTADEVPNWSAISNLPNGTTATPPPPPPPPPPPADTTPPAAVTNLSVTATAATSITVSWTAPGDDGTSGTASVYDLRYDTHSITSGNFANATAVANPPAPAAGGVIQSMTITGLTPSTTYWFALKTADEVPNWSGLSNVAPGATQAAPPPPPPADTTPPAAIADLAVTDIGQTTAVVSWTAPGDDGKDGTATTYELRMSTAPITAANFASAIAIAVPTPAPAGTAQQASVSDLAPSTAYWFAIRTADEVPNWSALSNVASDTTATPPPPPDTTPPAPVQDLAAVDVTTTGLTLTWTAPGDDGTVGTAATFDVRMSTGPIGPSTFGEASVVAGPPVPGPPGAAQALVVTGLTSGVEYFFAVKTADEVPNWSTLGNVVSVTLPYPDTGPPAAPTQLAAFRDGTLVTIGWAPNAEPNLLGYHLYRRRTNSGWVRLTDQPHTVTSCTDTLSSRPTTVDYAVTAVNTANEESPKSEPVTVVIDDLLPPPTIELTSVGPNPFTHGVTIELNAGSVATEVRIRVLDARGRLVRTLNAGNPGGVTWWTWDGRDENGSEQPAGIYFVRVEAGGRAESRKIVRVR